MTATDILPEPDETTAISIVSNHFSEIPTGISRFTTGSGNYVFEVSFAKNPAIVVRIAHYGEYASGEWTIFLSKQLTPLGVPLPGLLGDGIYTGFPYVILERLSGSDLADTMNTLSSDQLNSIAVQVAKAQNIVSSIPSFGKYGYSAHAESAPFSKWSEVITAHLRRSRQRIAEARLFEAEAVDALERIAGKMKKQLDTIPTIPFLHDTTTKNVLVTENGEFSGIVDVDDLCFGDPRYAPALTLASIMAFGGQERYVETWMREGNMIADNLFDLYVALFLVDFMSEQGQRFNGNQKKSDPRVRKKLLRLLNEVLGKFT